MSLQQRQVVVDETAQVCQNLVVRQTAAELGVGKLRVEFEILALVVVVTHQRKAFATQSVGVEVVDTVVDIGLARKVVQTRSLHIGYCIERYNCHRVAAVETERRQVATLHIQHTHILGFGLVEVGRTVKGHHQVGVTAIDARVDASSVDCSFGGDGFVGVVEQSHAIHIQVVGGVEAFGRQCATQRSIHTHATHLGG